MPLDIEQILIIAIICGLFLSGGLIVLYYILRAINNINTKEREAGKAFETEFLLSDKIRNQQPFKEKKMHAGSALVEESEPDAFAETLDNMPQYNDGGVSVSASPPVVESQSTEEQDAQATSDKTCQPPSSVISPMEELRHQARNGNPVASAIWKIYQAGQLETLEELIPLGASYSPAQAILLANGKRWIVLPPNHPENILARLSADCDAFVVFPDGSTPFLAISLGQYLVENIFEPKA